MILKSPPCQRPVFTYKHGWHRQDCIVSADGHSITWGGRSVLGEELLNLTAEMGVICYAARTPELTVFDFSYSHLCPMALEKIRASLCN